jgi:hypothetical protein
LVVNIIVVALRVPVHAAVVPPVYEVDPGQTDNVVYVVVVQEVVAKVEVVVCVVVKVFVVVVL